MRPTIKRSIDEFLARQAAVALLKSLAKSEVAKMLTGYKTYIVALVLGLLAALKFMGIEIPGMTENADPGSLIAMAAGLLFARNGAKTEVKKTLE